VDRFVYYQATNRVDCELYGNNVYLDARDSGGGGHVSTVALAGVADTNYGMSCEHTADGRVYAFNTTAGTRGSVATGSTQTYSDPVSYIGSVASGAVGQGNWIRGLNFSNPESQYTLSAPQRTDGNQLSPLVFPGANLYYSHAHHDCMNVFDSDFTVTSLVLESTDANPSQSTLFAHGSGNVDGLYCFQDVSDGDKFVCYANSGAGHVQANSTTNFTKELFHTVQAVRSGNWMTVYVDGVAGTPVNVAGYGIDGSRTLFLGMYTAASSYYWSGKVAYFRIDAEAASVNKLLHDREVLQGVYSNANWNQ
jgi:hypothetical protein